MLWGMVSYVIWGVPALLWCKCSNSRHDQSLLCTRKCHLRSKSTHSVCTVVSAAAGNAVLQACKLCRHTPVTKHYNSICAASMSTGTNCSSCTDIRFNHTHSQITMYQVCHSIGHRHEQVEGACLRRGLQGRHSCRRGCCPHQPHFSQGQFWNILPSELMLRQEGYRLCLWLWCVDDIRLCFATQWVLTLQTVEQAGEVAAVSLQRIACHCQGRHTA